MGIQPEIDTYLVNNVARRIHLRLNHSFKEVCAESPAVRTQVSNILQFRKLVAERVRKLRNGQIIDA